MDARHKNKAFIGVGIWVAAIPLAVLVIVATRLFSPNAMPRMDGFLVIAVLLTQYVAFFWGASHLAKAKGYSNAMVLAGIFWPLQILIFGLLLFAMPDRLSLRNGQRSKHRSGHRTGESAIGRVVRYRRNAFVANLFGVVGILVALDFVFYPAGLFSTRDNARVAAIFLFVPSYAAVIYGAWFWVRAKGWPDAVVLIGLLPLVILCIPYVRLIYLRAPLLLPAGMTLMPILLLGVIAALPDKSGMPRRKRWDRD